MSGSNLLSQETWQYLDGLGRPTNNLKRQHHPTRGANYDIFGKVDVLTAMEYDNFGRVTKDYVPYQSAYDNGAYWAVVPGTPFALTQYENSPLSRVTSVTPPGGYATTTAYGSNTSVLTVPGTSLSYPVGSLYETRTTDPDNRVNITYTDKRGRMILSHQTNTSGTNPADTYYQYDDKDRLTRVIPPGASAANADLIYTYEYDAGDRLTKKKVPGAGHQYMKYNTRDLLVFSRDSNLVAAGQSLGYKYDDYGRVLETGLVTGFPSDPNAAFTFAELLTKNYYDGYDGSTQLSLTTFPQYRGRLRRSENRVLGTNTWLHSTITYDTYGRIIQTQGNNYLNSTTANAETTVNSYDFSDFLILSTRTHLPGSAASTGNQTIKTNYLNDHAGRKTDLLLEVAGINTHLAKYSYDFRERLIERNLHSGLYGSTWAWLQSVDYAYNDQDWLTAINTKNATGTSQALSATCSPSLPNPGTTPLVTYPEDNDLFYLELRYDQLFTTSSSTGGTISGLYEFPQKAGNIAQMVWRVRGRERQAYSFNYDHLSRLSFSLNYDVNTSNVASSSYRFNESYSYDNRGNIMSMYRNGYYQDGGACTFGQIDNLSYTYASNSNRLTSISDYTSIAAAKARGFNPGLGGSGYTYDSNGNLKTDSYKGITNISYNHLNLPRLITFSSGNTIEIIYDAAGTKLRKIVRQSGTVQYEQDYNGGLEYRKTPASGTFRIEALYHEEGRYFNLNVDANNTVSWRKEYAIRDHLGSTRITFADKNTNGIVEVPGEILQENHYYPFGLSYEGPAWMNDAARDNKYQYNGKEWHDDFGLNWNDYGARWYDAAVGRWWSVDPLADEPEQADRSPYAYAWNTPIRLIDPDGQFPIIPIIWAAYEIGSAIYDGYQAYKTVSDKNATSGEKAAAVGGVLLSAVLPGGGYGTAAKATVNATKTISREAVERGVKNETKAIAKEGLEKNTKTFTAIDHKTKQPISVKPDVIDSKKVTEIKDVKTLSNTKQIRAEREVAKKQGKKFEIITGERTKVSRNIPEKELRRVEYLCPQKQ